MVYPERAAAENSPHCNKARYCRSVRPLASAMAFGSTLLLARLGAAGTAWGDASLSRDDVRIELDESGRAAITHSVLVHVSGKRFRAFVIDGVEDALEPPTDEVSLAGRDGPGWPAAAVDAKGLPIDAFVEPTKEPRKLRIRLGHDGVPRGDYTIQIRYYVDFGKLGAFSRDGAMTKLTWTAPRWPEGYDGAKIVVVVPAAKSEPVVSLADPGGEGEHPLDGFAIARVHRGSARDEIEITRPHVPAHDDAHFILRVDPHALPGVAASAAAIEAAKPPTFAYAPRARFVMPALAGAIGLLLAFLHHRRDREPFRPLIGGSPGSRALLYGASAGFAVFATWSSWPLVGAVLILLAIAASTLRAPRPEPTRGSGRWLAIPEIAVPAPIARERSYAWILVAAAVAIAFGLLLRRDHRAAIALAMNAAILLPLFVTGTARQLPPDRVADAWRVLSPIAKALDRPKIIARTVGRTIDEVRLRIDGRGSIRTLEVGCALVHGAGGSSLVPEILVRVELSATLPMRMPIEDEHVDALGRTEDERTICIRPASSEPRAIRASIDALFAAAESARKPIERAAA